MSSADTKALGAEVRRRRIEKGLTHRELAKRAGLTPLCIGDVERGACNSSISVIQEIARGVGVQTGALFPGQRGVSAAGVEFATLFDAVDVSQATVSDVPSGAALPVPQIARSVERLLGATPGALLSTPSTDPERALTRAA